MEDFLERIENEFVHSENEVANKLKECLIDVREEIPPPEIAWEALVQSSNEFTIIGTLGNFSLVKGKAKSKKSFFISMAVSSAIGEGAIHDVMRSPLKSGNDQVLYFDTEQSKYHVQKAIKRICSQIKAEVPPNLKPYSLRKENPEQRLKMVEYAINNTPNLGFVVIDGIRDLITSINSEEEATNIASKLLNWTETFNIHILTVLHENPTGDKARGHLGTELTNKAETIIAVEVDSDNPDVSIVKPSSCRNKPFDPFAFCVNDNGIPEVIPDYSFKSSSKKKPDLSTLSDQESISIFRAVLPESTSRTHGDLQIGLQNYFKEVNRNYSGVGVNKVKEFITNSKNRDLIIQLQPRGAYSINKSKIFNS